MEDYLSAFKERALDTHLLFRASRAIGSMHLGGVVIECLLKAMIVKQLNLTEWKKPNNPSAPANPRHELIRAINMIPELRRRLDATPEMENYFKIIQRPIKKYIDMRYEGSQVSTETYRNWLTAYKSVLKWLHSQKMH